MSSLKEKVLRRISIGYKRYILRDPFERAIQRWRKDDGDRTLRQEYPLDKKSVVVDIGGYKGDFAQAIHDRFDCSIVIFEPVPVFFQECVSRFTGYDRIKVLNYGLSSQDDSMTLAMAEDGSSFLNRSRGGKEIKATLRRAERVFQELKLTSIDLMKINIEGGEYDLLTHLIETGSIANINFLQIQFHDFIKDAPAMRDAIRAQLALTHDEMWNYDFVWESWKRR